MTLYDCNKGIEVSSHASAYELGRVVLQQQDDESWKPIAYFSRALRVEALYSPIKKECLRFAWVCEPASDYILGKPNIKETDHKQLLPMLTTHHLDQLPPRIQRFRMRLMRFSIESMVHVPGKNVKNASKEHKRCA